MKMKSLILITIIALTTLGFADGVGTDVGKAGKATAKVAEKTATGAAHGTEDVAKGTGKVVKVTAHGTERAAVATGHGVKTATVKTVDVLK